MDAARLAAVVSPLKRALLVSARERAGVPDIADAQIEVLRLLPRGVTRAPGELAEVLGVRRTTVSTLLTAMEAAGLIDRRPRDDDRRRVDVTASDRALGYLDAYDRAAAALIDEVMRTWDEVDIAPLSAALPALERLSGGLRAVRVAPSERTSA